MSRDSTVGKYYNFGNLEVSSLYKFKEKQKCLDNYIFNFLTKLLEMGKYKGLPDSIPQEELEKLLLINGFCVVNIDSEKPLALAGGWGGELDDYYHPLSVIVNNPWAGINKEFRIGEDCVLCRNDSFCIGLMPLLSKYCTGLVETDLSINISTAFKRMTALFSTTDDKTVESAQKFIDSIYEGEYKVVYDEGLVDTLKAQELVGSGGSNLLSQLIEVRQYILGSLYNEIGLKSVTNMKKENISELESDQNTDILITLISNMVRCRKEFCSELSEKLGLEITYELSSVWKARNEEVVKKIKNLKEGDEDDVE